MGSSSPYKSFSFTTFSPSDPIFAQLAPTSLPSLSNSIRRQTRTLRNRLRSIHTDAIFVRTVADAFDLPILTNSRAGDWYVDPERSAGAVYFKSTDGHYGEWKFSRRRLNFKVLEVAGKDGRGAIIVDSTRRGKRFPDSLSKTIPIWIAVLNHVLFPPTHNSSSHPELFTTPLAVSPSEHAQITALLPGFVDDFLKLGVDLTWMKEVVKKPMRAIFLHPDSPLPSSPPQFEEFTPLVLVTASKMMKGDGMEGEYIQGAGDDHEGWVGESGLSPSLFWRYAEELVGMPDDEKLLQLLYAVRKTDKTVSSVISKATLIRPTQNIYIASRADVESGNVAEQHGIVVNCGPEPLVLSKHSGAQSGKVKVLDLGLPTGKAAGKRIRTVLEPQLLSIKLKLEQSLTAVFVCDTGDGVAPAVTLAVLCLFYNEKGMTKEGLKGAKEKNDDAWS